MQKKNREISGSQFCFLIIQSSSLDIYLHIAGGDETFLTFWWGIFMRPFRCPVWF